MLKRILAATAMLCALGAVARAEIIPIPNGSFEADTPATGFTSTVTNWSINLTSSFPSPRLNEEVGLFTTIGGFLPTDGGQFIMINNTGAGGEITLSTGLIQLNQRIIQFDYSYITDHTLGSGVSDQFKVIVDIFTLATDPFPATTLVFNIANSEDAVFTSGVGTTPFDTGTTTNQNTPGTSFDTVYLPVPQFFKSFARIKFVVDSSGPQPYDGVSPITPTTNLGVSGIVLDNVVLSPEPGTWALFAFGTLALSGIAIRRRRRKIVPAE